MAPKAERAATPTFDFDAETSHVCFLLDTDDRTVYIGLRDSGTSGPNQNWGAFFTLEHNRASHKYEMTDTRTQMQVPLKHVRLFGTTNDKAPCYFPLILWDLPMYWPVSLSTRDTDRGLKAWVAPFAPNDTAWMWTEDDVNFQRVDKATLGQKVEGLDNCEVQGIIGFSQNSASRLRVRDINHLAAFSNRRWAPALALARKSPDMDTALTFMDMQAEVYTSTVKPV